MEVHSEVVWCNHGREAALVKAVTSRVTNRTASNSRHHRFTMMINEKRSADYALDARLARLATILLWLLFGCFVAAHLFPGRLNPMQHVISQYASSAPSKVLITACMILLGLLSAVLGFRMALCLRRPQFLLAGMLLFCALLPLRYTAAYQALAVSEAKRAPYWWEFWKSSPGPNVWDNAIARVHEDVIRDACVAITLAMIVFALGSRLTRPAQKAPASITFSFGAAALVFFLLRIAFNGWQGLWQRLGFICIVAWLTWLNIYLSRTRLVNEDVDTGRPVLDRDASV